LVDQHRASGDARATLELFKLLMFKDKDSEIIQQHHDEVNAKSYLNKIRDLTQDLPAEKGIVYFQDKNGKIILFDFVEDLNKYSKGVFYSKSKRFIDIQEDVEQIYYELTGNDILAKLMMNSKGLTKQETFQFGLFDKNSKYFVDKINNQKKDQPFLKFKSFTQGIKAVSYIEANENLKNLENLKQLLTINKADELWLSTGRVLGEKSFLQFEKGELTSYGFYEFFTQIASLKKLSSLKINIDFPTDNIENDLKLGLLRGDFEKTPIPFQ